MLEISSERTAQLIAEVLRIRERTQGWLARKLGVHPNKISNLIRTKTQLRLEDVAAISIVLEVPVAQLLGLEPLSILSPLEVAASHDRVEMNDGADCGAELQDAKALAA